MAVRRCSEVYSWMRSALKITETSSRDLVPIDKPVFRFPKQAKQVPELPKMKDPKEFIRCLFGPFLTVIVCLHTVRLLGCEGPWLNPGEIYDSQQPLASPAAKVASLVSDCLPFWAPSWAIFGARSSENDEWPWSMDWIKGKFTGKNHI